MVSVGADRPKTTRRRSFSMRYMLCIASLALLVSLMFRSFPSVDIPIEYQLLQYPLNQPSDVGDSSSSSEVSVLSRSPYEYPVSTHPKPQHLPRPTITNRRFTRKIIIIPEHKLFFCYIEKTGCSMFNHLFRMVRLLHPSMKKKMNEARFQSQYTWFRNEPKHFGLSVSDLEDILQDPDWTKAIFFRDPVSRFTSAFRSKCGLQDKDGFRHCGQTFGSDITGSVQDFRKAIQMLDNPVAKERIVDNPHFAPMANFCGGLENTLDFYDFIHLLDKQTAPRLIRQLLLHIGVDRDDTDALVENVVQSGATNVTWEKRVVRERLGIPLKEAESQRPQHNTGGGGKNEVENYFGGDLDRLRRLQEHYAMDYELFGLPRLGFDRNTFSEEQEYGDDDEPSSNEDE